MSVSIYVFHLDLIFSGLQCPDSKRTMFRDILAKAELKDFEKFMVKCTPFSLYVIYGILLHSNFYSSIFVRKIAASAVSASVVLTAQPNRCWTFEANADIRE